MDFTIPVDQRMNIKRKQKDKQILRPCQRTKKAMEHDGMCDINCNWYAWNGLEERLEELEIRGWIENIQTTALLRLVRMICCHSNFCERPSANAHKEQK